ncbi:conserved hypothetical protein [Brochothrix thermosphacta]|uniref:Uncharacterized protein n=1 Tax=Brochothrix thermosphacta TaxID=2756 RepID=A0A2X0QPA9_BROTH|nr:hypothetical protein FM106_18990 [Brachybacterium faecium]SOC04289.1 hypothetical protein BTH160X_120008 [Brochothrix thermosphacta]SPP26155.1 conserved hypothetical protein [Brochothrix thermosphacta]SPP29973.1 conserved hypothetical protein [Brochothrix thermosphacta]
MDYHTYRNKIGYNSIMLYAYTETNKRKHPKYYRPGERNAYKIEV